ncbi:FAD-binding domain-containing protein [Nocardioides cynanchi]|uniref:FAD-binding domain-containing protein n=1 Tax=Nocardioides cynanchi TaxID=2558918 RepID=UPI001245B77E
MNAVLWLRRDLRRRDLPALGAAADVAGDGEVHVLFVIDPVLWDGCGPARRGWLAASLRAAAASYDGRLTVRVGDPVTKVAAFAADVGAGSVHVSAETTPYGARRDERVRARLAERGLDWVPTGSPYAVGPGRVLTKDGTPYRVFTPFSRAWREHGWAEPATAPRDLALGDDRSDDRAARRLDDALADCPVGLPTAGEDAALRRWRAFRDDRLAAYADGRDRPDVAGTSQLSPYLKVGAIHPRTMLADLAGSRSRAAEVFTNELGWREFYADVLHSNPESAWHDLRPELGSMAYDADPALVSAWREGHTGFPIVDAGMRQLAGSGWMHNRVRMITASFLCKDLHAWWGAGASHFLAHLIDGDVASNNHGWQWVAGTGTDASPYFRVFNPVTQGKKFDPQGDYVRRWVPELAHVAGAKAHEPWTVDDGYRHGYPTPVVDHAEERVEALRRYEEARR